MHSRFSDGPRDALDELSRWLHSAHWQIEMVLAESLTQLDLCSLFPPCPLPVDVLQCLELLSYAYLCRLYLSGKPCPVSESPERFAAEAQGAAVTLPTPSQQRHGEAAQSSFSRPCKQLRRPSSSSPQSARAPASSAPSPAPSRRLPHLSPLAGPNQLPCRPRVSVARGLLCTGRDGLAVLRAHARASSADLFHHHSLSVTAMQRLSPRRRRCSVARVTTCRSVLSACPTSARVPSSTSCPAAVRP